MPTQTRRRARCEGAARRLAVRQAAAFAPRRMRTPTRGVCRSSPGRNGTAAAAATVPRANNPHPPKFSLANRLTVSPAAMHLPPYRVLSASKTNSRAAISVASVSIA